MRHQPLPPLTAPPTADEIRATHEAIAALIHRTPVMRSSSLDAITGATLYFKCENLQKIGAFKMRGASSAALRLRPADLKKGLATHSSGNHAQAVALTAQVLGVPAYIVMPENAPAPKAAATKAYGAEVILCEGTLQGREKALREVVARTGAYFIPPYDDYNVIAGQATAAKELIEDAGDVLDSLIAPVGGGGLLSGTALAARYFSPGTRVYGAEPERVNDAYRSLQSGRIETNDRTDTIADGLRTTLSEKTFGIIRREVEGILTVDEEAIVRAMRLLWERMKIVVEPSGAVPLAAVLTYPEAFKDRRVGLILTGGNVDLEQLPF